LYHNVTLVTNASHPQIQVFFPMYHNWLGISRQSFRTTRRTSSHAHVCLHSAETKPGKQPRSSNKWSQCKYTVADKKHPALFTLSRSYLSNGRAIGMVVIHRLYLVHQSKMYCGFVAKR